MKFNPYHLVMEAKKKIDATKKDKEAEAADYEEEVDFDDATDEEEDAANEPDSEDDEEEGPITAEDEDAGEDATDYGEEYNEEEEVEGEEEPSGEEDLEVTDYGEDSSEEDSVEGEEESSDEEPTDYGEGADEEGSEEADQEEGTEEESSDEPVTAEDASEEGEETPKDLSEDRKNYNLFLNTRELYNGLRATRDRLTASAAHGHLSNRVVAQVRNNLEVLGKQINSYLLYNFNKNTYVRNLYHYNLFIESLRMNVEMLKKVNALREVENAKKPKQF